MKRGALDYRSRRPHAGSCARIGEHHWLESDGWTFDCSHGAKRAALVMRVTTYRRLRGAGHVHQGGFDHAHRVNTERRRKKS